MPPPRPVVELISGDAAVARTAQSGVAVGSEGGAPFPHTDAWVASGVCETSRVPPASSSASGNECTAPLSSMAGSGEITRTPNANSAPICRAWTAGLAISVGSIVAAMTSAARGRSGCSGSAVAVRCAAPIVEAEPPARLCAGGKSGAMTIGPAWENPAGSTNQQGIRGGREATANAMDVGATNPSASFFWPGIGRFDSGAALFPTLFARPPTGSPARHPSIKDPKPLPPPSSLLAAAPVGSPLEGMDLTP